MNSRDNEKRLNRLYRIKFKRLDKRIKTKAILSMKEKHPEIDENSTQYYYVMHEIAKNYEAMYKIPLD